MTRVKMRLAGLHFARPLLVTSTTRRVAWAAAERCRSTGQPTRSRGEEGLAGTAAEVPRGVGRLRGERDTASEARSGLGLQRVPRIAPLAG